MKKLVLVVTLFLIALSGVGWAFPPAGITFLLPNYTEKECMKFISWDTPTSGTMEWIECPKVIIEDSTPLQLPTKITFDNILTQHQYIKNLEQKIQELERRIYELEQINRCRNSNYLTDDCVTRFRLIGR